MRRRIARGAYGTDPIDEAGLLGIDEIDRPVGPIGQYVEFNLRIYEADVECAQPIAADVDLFLQISASSKSPGVPFSPGITEARRSPIEAPSGGRPSDNAREID
jgi:hypothetical protein